MLLGASTLCGMNLDLDYEGSSRRQGISLDDEGPRRGEKPIAVQPAGGDHQPSCGADDGPIATQSGDLTPEDFFFFEENAGAVDGDHTDGDHTDGVVGGRAAALLVPHVRQQMTWDCGVACVAMILRCVGFPLSQ